MRSAYLDKAFNHSEEREFLRELAEQALGEAHEVLAEHKEDEADVTNFETHVAIIARQERRITFLEDLYANLEPGGE